MLSWMDRSICILGLTCVSAWLAGCASIDDPFKTQYAKPPAALGDGLDRPPRRTVIVLGTLGDPAGNPLKWAGIGADMADALSRTMMADGGFDVRIDRSLAERTRRAVETGSAPGQAAEGLEAIRRDHPEVDYVITGRVTDFHHTADLPARYTRRGLFGKNNEAIAAIDLVVVDLRRPRIAIADQVVGIARAGKEPTEAQYANLSFDSYLFWSSPLGKASRKALDETHRRLKRVIPSHAAEIDVIRRAGWRELALRGGSAHGIKRGQRYFVYVRNPATNRLRPVIDELLGTPLEAQIVRVKKASSVAWLIGEAPAEVNLNDAVLARVRPDEASRQDADRMAEAQSEG